MVFQNVVPCLSEQTVFMVLPLADEYQIVSLKQECKDMMIKMLRNSYCGLDVKLKMYSLANIYPDMDEIWEESLNRISQCSLDSIKSQDNYKSMTDKMIIVEERVRFLEEQINDAKAALSSGRCASHRRYANGDCLSCSQKIIQNITKKL